MPPDPTPDDVEADLAVYEEITTHVATMIERLGPTGVLEKTFRRWLTGHAELPDDEEEKECLMAMAADLELFTPSLTGRTLVDRYLKTATSETDEQQQALQALGAAQFRLVRVSGRDGPELIRLEDLVTQESLQLLDPRIAPEAAGLPTAMRLCPLASGRQVVISPLFAMDEAMLAAAMTFVRPGRSLGHGYRCAASLYRDAARRGFEPLPQIPLDEEALLDLVRKMEETLPPIQRLALRWIGGVDAEADLVLAARDLASGPNLVETLGFFGDIEAGADVDTAAELPKAYAEIAATLVETIARRAQAGVTDATTLDRVAAEIAGHIASGKMKAGARELLERLRSAASATAKPAGPGAAATADIDRVIQRIQALRARTVDHGCTEAEAMAAAAKVSELLDRHDLTLDEISVRRSECEGIGIDTGRKRRTPVDHCMPSIATFCDCRVWSEEVADGMMRHVFFGLKADVAAARFLHDLITVTFATESDNFRRGPIYQALRGSGRRTALDSFQIGLAGGIAAKLVEIKAGRRSARPKRTGFDLVAVKNRVVDAEIEQLGLNFSTRRSASRRRSVHGGAYDAGKKAGSRFEPNAALQG